MDGYTYNKNSVLEKYDQEPTEYSHNLVNSGNIQKYVDAADALVDAKVDQMISRVGNPFVFKGTKATTSALPSSGNTVNDTWFVTETGFMYTWNGTSWDQTSTDVNNQLSRDIATAYSETKSDYKHGDLVLYNNQVYMRKNDATQADGAFVSSNWTAISLGDRVRTLQSDVEDLFASPFDPTLAYNEGDYVIYNDNFYRAKTDISADTAWSTANWEQVTVDTELHRRDDIITDLEGTIDKSLWAEENGTYISGKYIKSNYEVGTIVDVDGADLVSSTSFTCAIITCEKGDKFIVNGMGGDAPRLWCFTDTEYRILSKSGNNARGPVILKSESDGYLIVNSEKTVAHQAKHYFVMNCAGKIQNLEEDVTDIKTRNTPYAQSVFSTYLAHRYLNNNTGVPTTTTSNAWNLYILDVSNVSSLEFTIYKSSTSNLLCWSFSSVLFEDATLSTLADNTKIVDKGIITTSTGALTWYVNVPEGAKTMLIPSASAYASSYPTVVSYNYGEFQFLKYVPSMVEQKPKLDALMVYNNSPYYRNVRWGCPCFDGYYHSEDNGTSEFPSTTTAVQYFSKFNALVADYTGYAESHEMGLASDGTTMMYYYTFYPKTNQNSEIYKMPKIIVSAGQHGFEKTANFGVYYFAKDLLENWQSNPFLAYVRNHAQLILMPMLNPYGFDHDVYVNANGVNLNRNWDTTGWSKGTPGTITYAGEAPLDQPETQYASAVILANLDAIWLCDYHNNGQSTPSSQTGYLWHSFALVTYDDEYFKKSIQAAKWHIDETTGHLYVDFPGAVSYANCGTFTDDNAPSHQGLIVAYAREHDIMAATMEGGAAFESGGRFASSIGHMNADLLGNWIRCLFSTFAHYNE